ncbi:MAG TPA: hypothetical protein VHP63_06955, partial [candidate division Zixibacteria bacterium]|nr:hypothetical protein [candidate division Zixibacteria bacterium]
TENIGPLFTPISKTDNFKSELRMLLTGLGFDEIIGHGFTDSRLANMITPQMASLKIQNPVSAELDVMRNSLIPFALTVVQHNMSFRTMDLRLFEIGKAFIPSDSKEKWTEKDRLLILVTGQVHGTWRDKTRKLDFFDITGSLTRLAEHFDWPQLEFKNSKINCFDNEQSFDIFSGNTQIGEIGLLSKSIAQKLDIKQDLFLAELSVDSLIGQSGGLREFKPMPIYPAAPRDLAIIVDQSVKAGEIVRVVKKAAGELAENVEIFDLYQGAQIAAGKKSLAISITYRSPDGSLSSNQVDNQQRLVIEQLKSAFNAEIRDK